MKNILIISASLRGDSNSELLAGEFERGARDAGNRVEMISLKGKTIGFCRGCVACQKTRRCVIPDDAIEIAEKVKNADVPLFATPIYYYGMCGQLGPVRAHRGQKCAAGDVLGAFKGRESEIGGLSALAAPPPRAVSPN